MDLSSLPRFLYLVASMVLSACQQGKECNTGPEVRMPGSVSGCAVHCLCDPREGVLLSSYKIVSQLHALRCHEMFRNNRQQIHRVREKKRWSKATFWQEKTFFPPHFALWIKWHKLLGGYTEPFKLWKAHVFPKSLVCKHINHHLPECFNDEPFLQYVQRQAIPKLLQRVANPLGQVQQY